MRQTAAADLAAKTTAVVTALKNVITAQTYLNDVKSGALLNGGTAITIYPLKLKTSSTSGTEKIGSINQISLTLPAGVTIFPTPATGIVLSGVAKLCFKSHGGLYHEVPGCRPVWQVSKHNMLKSIANGISTSTAESRHWGVWLKKPHKKAC